MSRLVAWLDDRTGMRQIVHDALYERIPGGARWRYVWGSTLVFAFVTQMITGIFLWMCYSPSSRSAWESVYYIQYEMQLGWLLRGVHHFMAHAMVVLLVLHLLQVVIDGAYRAPREFNFWVGLLLMLLVLGLSLTGYLLPWDQKGFWATAVATNLMSFVPWLGQGLQRLVVGGSEYGHHTLTRFFALHAGVLPGLLIFLLVIHLALFRKHGVKARPSSRPDQYFWPEQVLRDAVACLAVLAVVLLLCFKGLVGDHTGQVPGDYLGAELTAPADPSQQYSAARPEWYFLFLFELLKYFTPENLGPLGSEFVGAIVVPGVAMAFLFLMPILGRWKLGHGFNVAMVIALVLGAGLLTLRALHTDRYARWETGGKVPDDPSARQRHESKLKQSRDFLAAVEQAHREARRIKQVIHARGGVPYEGAIALMRNDAEIQGPRLFRQHCASCHSYLDANGEGIPGPPTPEPGADGEVPPYGCANLYGFASREWLSGLLDPDKIVSDAYFGTTAHRDGDMASFVQDQIRHLDEDGKTALASIIAALSAEAQLVRQSRMDERARADGTIDAGIAALSSPLSSPEATDEYSCTDCHRFQGEGALGSAPDLTGYGSQEWLVGIISDPRHERFYEYSHDRMPSYAAYPDEPRRNIFNAEELRLIARWLRGDDHQLDVGSRTTREPTGPAE